MRAPPLLGPGVVLDGAGFLIPSDRRHAVLHVLAAPNSVGGIKALVDSLPPPPYMDAAPQPTDSVRRRSKKFNPRAGWVCQHDVNQRAQPDAIRLQPEGLKTALLRLDATSRKGTLHKSPSILVLPHRA